MTQMACAPVGRRVLCPSSTVRLLLRASASAARRILKANRKRVTDSEHRGLVKKSDLQLLERSLRVFEDELIRLVKEQVSQPHPKEKPRHDDLH